MNGSEEAPFGASSRSLRRPSRPSGATGEPVEHEGATGEQVERQSGTGDPVEPETGSRGPAAWTPAAESHLAELWNAIDAHAPEAFRRLVDQAVEHAPPAVAEFELAGVHDSFGEESLAEPRYRRALALGLEPDREAQCRIQLASTLRNLGRAEEGLELLQPLLDAATAVEADARTAAFAAYAPQARGFAALCLSSLGRDREAVRLAVGGIGASVTRYSRSLTGYAAELPER